MTSPLPEGTGVSQTSPAQPAPARKHPFGLTASVIAIVGTIVGALAFTSAATAETDAVGDTDTAVVQAAGAQSEDGAANEGTRENPFPLGTTFATDDWTVTVNAVTLDATQAVMSEDTRNDEPDAGFQYALLNMDLTYTGDAPAGEAPVFVTVKYVTADGRTISQLTKDATGPEQMDRLSTLPNGATASGNIVLHVPTDAAADGVLAITPGIYADATFVALQ